VDHGWRVPGKRVAIDETQFLDLIDQMRITIPAEIKQAREIQEERDRYVAQAHEEARQILAQAREDAARLLDEHKLRQVAEEHAETIKKRAEQEARRVREGADEYAETRLLEMRETLSELQRVVQNGLEELALRRAQASGSVADAFAHKCEQAASAEASQQPAPEPAVADPPPDEPTPPA